MLMDERSRLESRLIIIQEDISTHGSILADELKKMPGVHLELWDLIPNGTRSTVKAQSWVSFGEVNVDISQQPTSSQEQTTNPHQGERNRSGFATPTSSGYQNSGAQPMNFNANATGSNNHFNNFVFPISGGTNDNRDNAQGWDQNLETDLPDELLNSDFDLI